MSTKMVLFKSVLPPGPIPYLWVLTVCQFVGENYLVPAIDESTPQMKDIGDFSARLPTDNEILNAVVVEDRQEFFEVVEDRGPALSWRKRKG